MCHFHTRTFSLSLVHFFHSFLLSLLKKSEFIDGVYLFDISHWDSGFLQLLLETEWTSNQKSDKIWTPQITDICSLQSIINNTYNTFDSMRKRKGRKHMLLIYRNEEEVSEVFVFLFLIFDSFNIETNQ
jgi:hypothetical protein